MKTLRERKKASLTLLKKIAAFIEKNESSPTVRQVASMANVKSSSHGQLLLKTLEECGFIERIPGKARSIKLKQMKTSL